MGFLKDDRPLAWHKSVVGDMTFLLVRESGFNMKLSLLHQGKEFQGKACGAAAYPMKNHIDCGLEARTYHRRRNDTTRNCLE